MSLTIFVDDSDVLHVLQDGTDILAMKEEEDKKSGRMLLSLSGKLTHNSVPAFFDEVSALISMGVKITLNMKELSYLDSGAVTALVRLEQQAERKGWEDGVLLTSLSPSVLEGLKNVGATDLLWIE